MSKVRSKVGENMDNTFTLICNNCGAKSTIRMEETMWHEDDQGKYFTRSIIQEGETSIYVNCNFQETEVICSKCGVRIDDINRAEYKDCD